ncbi:MULTISPECIES: acetyl-CoA carboxylase biotin carboxyl carrier protein [Fusobacterium]|jgi:acetyl-CoA carboxylase biotin carboxyl carrier protein|uniref:Biotin carboxyl carrier protein of acetyl-CoA carboxylase n=2 Tax=Fusobacterium ulcerans TaxID=861 RepID=A0AAX2JB10_9FUSO|nr:MULTISPECIES: acetyl-CoA carboxylase biotin carboxyl carrier protein [Fusobacterium]AVQ29598.1 acetyl-CoA carboxylase biotin carboxyl carrier protein [Fusobacterium ulcerans]EFS25367.2 acetyl-CoA carboxylase, biotin carboxyl carrier protein [Fusobacterium ulcerans ATCC 49185]EHO84055.1 acetyl-CoA carboxylase, biotin carboxyl carrier protein [Fusobacterium ulcerans 12-1B]MDH6459375.1 acetyl-CoA carboxylase biotin carboxyl carrier protein [Fusobacterium sp. PH5-7]SQJ04421.1 Biotin carboxyl ca
MKIDLKTIKDLAENIEKYNLNEVVIESEGAKVTLKKEIPVVMETVAAVPRAAAVQNIEVPVMEEAAEAAAETEEMETINSPMVGTFYKSSAPGNPAFIAEGQTVSAGDTLCIIEAMKLMNEVKSHKNCTIVKILVEDGQLVKKGDKLFSVK